MRSPLHNVGALDRAARGARRGAAARSRDEERSARLPPRSRSAARARRAGSRRSGVARGDRVALAARQPHAPTSSSCSRRARIGAIAVPLNTRLAAPELRALLADCTPRAARARARRSRAGGGGAARRAARAAGALAVGGAPDAYEAALAAPRRTPTIAAGRRPTTR